MLIYKKQLSDFRAVAQMTLALRSEVVELPGWADLVGEAGPPARWMLRDTVGTAASLSSFRALLNVENEP